VSQFWVPEAVALAPADVKSWGTLTPDEKQLVLHVFTGLTMLDTVQGRFGANALKNDATTLFEEAIYDNIAFMEQIHARSYSRIFSTLASTPEINQAFRWSSENEYLRKKVEIVMKYYRAHTSDPVERSKKKIVSVFLESFLFYSGFYLPIFFAGQSKLVNTSSMIRLIMRDEAVHGYYIGAKFQETYRTLDASQQIEVTEWAYDILDELYENEVRYTQDLYDGVALTEEVKQFLRYNANRALANLGFDPLYAKEQLNPVILNGMDLTQEAADFFSTKVTDYSVSTQANAELEEEDWEF
jgi:ribonucleoside-diphosphate reductase beta chain